MDHKHHQWNADKMADTPQIPRQNIRWVYVSGYYDGPYSGRVVVKSPKGVFDSSAETLWAEISEECNALDEDVTEDEDVINIEYTPQCGFYRRFLLYRLSEDADAEEQRRQQLFEEHVGTHWSYNEDGTKRMGELKPVEEHHKYYDQRKNWPEWKPKGEVVGWFQI